MSTIGKQVCCVDEVFSLAVQTDVLIPRYVLQVKIVSASVSASEMRRKVVENDGMTTGVAVSRPASRLLRERTRSVGR